MTCIAWDGKTLAGDKRACICSLMRTTTKIHRVKDALVGYCGDAAQGREMLAWARGGFKLSAFPESQRDEKAFAPLLVIQAGGVVEVYENTPHPIQYENKHFAIGSARDFALTAMYLGKCASDAVLIASEFDPGCGNGVDVLVLR